MKLFNDSSTNPNDLLNRKPFANQLANSIVSNLENKQESIIIGINGSWGNGKSTFLNYLNFEINEEATKKGINNKIIQINFNPWMFSGQESLQKNFLIELLTELQDKHTLISKKIDWLEDKLKYLSFLKHIEQTKGYFEGIESLAKGINVKETVKDLKSQVEKLLSEENIFLFIYIDDLDRLTPSETLEIFQLVKLNSNFINTYYFLAYDKDVIEKSLYQTFKENSKRYLEKIVQVDYKIPEPRLEDIEYVFFSRFKDLMNKQQIPYDEKELEDLWNIGNLSYFFKNLRDIYRFLNAIHLRLPAIWNEIYIFDFIIIEVIRIFDYNNFEALFIWTLENMREMGAFNPNSLHIENKTTDLLINLLCGNAFKKGNKAYIKILNKDLYFTFQLGKNDLSVKEFEKFIEKPNSAFLKTLGETNQFGGFIKHLAHINDFEIKDNFALILHHTFDFLDDDEQIRKFANEALRAISEAIKSNPTLFLIFKEKLFYDKDRLSQTQILFIHWILNNSELYYYFKNEDLVLLEKKKVSIFKKWENYILGNSNFKKPIWASSLFLNYFVEENSNWSEEISRIIEDRNCFLGLLEIMTSFNSLDNTPFQINYYTEWIKNVGLEKLFKEQLLELYNSIQFEKNKDKRILIELYYNVLFRTTKIDTSI